ncbi:hypothetical protein GCM10029976_087540 [Kribbella albertanoniae]
MVHLIIPCAGRASRMGELAREVPKTLLQVARPILARLVEDVIATGVGVRVLTRPDDVQIRAWAQRHGSKVQTQQVPSAPYGTLILRAAGPDQEVAAVDGDLAMPPGGLTNFLDFASREVPAVDLVIGVTQIPWDLGPTTIWWDPHSSDRPIGRGLPSPAARLAGLYWLRPAALTRLRAYVDAGHTSYSAFLTTFSRSETAAFELGYAYNINTPDDLAAANAHAAQHEEVKR